MHLKRLRSELARFPADDPLIRLVDCEDLLCWRVEITGAEGTIYAGEKYVVKFSFTEHYPIESPRVIFVDQIPTNGHVYSNGHICLSILYDEWIPSFTVESICISLISMLSAAQFKNRPPGDEDYSKSHHDPKKTSWGFHGKTLAIVLDSRIFCR